MADDPIGTVRREVHDSGCSIWQRLHPNATPGNEWMCVWSTAWQNIEATLPHEGVAGFPLIGAVPGTPAAAGLLAAPSPQPAIKVTVDREANAAYVRVAEGVVFRTAEINGSVHADYGQDFQLLGVEILDLPTAPDPDMRRVTAEMAAGLAEIAEMVGLWRETDEPEVIVRRVRERLAAPQAHLQAADELDGEAAQLASTANVDRHETEYAHGYRTAYERIVEWLREEFEPAAAPADDEDTIRRVAEALLAHQHGTTVGECPHEPTSYTRDAARAALAALRGEQQ